jgi:hypothetical protein
MKHVNFYLRHADAVASTNRHVSSIEDAKRVYALLAQGMRLNWKGLHSNLNHQTNGARNGRTCCNSENLLDS